MLRRALQNHPLHKLHRKRKGQEKKRYLVPYEPKDGPAPDKQAVVDRWDSILAACDDDVDRQIVELRRQNESYGSIAETLNVKSKSTISDRLRKIEKRMNGANDAHKERHCLCVVKTNANPGDSPMGITQFVESVTERAPGVATPLSKLRKQFERQYGPVNRSIFTNELGRRFSIGRDPPLHSSCLGSTPSAMTRRHHIYSLPTALPPSIVATV